MLNSIEKPLVLSKSSSLELTSGYEVKSRNLSNQKRDIEKRMFKASMKYDDSTYLDRSRIFSRPLQERKDGLTKKQTENSITKALKKFATSTIKSHATKTSEKLEELRVRKKFFEEISDSIDREARDFLATELHRMEREISHLMIIKDLLEALHGSYNRDEYRNAHYLHNQGSGNSLNKVVNKKGIDSSITKELETTIASINELEEDEDDDFAKPTEYAKNKAIELISEAASIRPNNFFKAWASTDGSGYVRLTWSKPENKGKKISLSIPPTNSSAQRASLYRNYGKTSAEFEYKVSAKTLSDWLEWLNS